MLDAKLQFGHLQLFYREIGSGQPIVLLHCAGGTSSQWRKLMERMSDRYRMFALDLPSHGQSDDVPPDTTNEFELYVQTVLACVKHVGAPVHLVGHSAGGGAAARFAIRYPDKLRSLVLFEPTLFGMMANGADDEGWNDYLRLATGITRQIDVENETGAAEMLVDYWSAPGMFQKLSPEQQNKITKGIRVAAELARKTIANPAEYSIDASRIRTATLVLGGAASPRSAWGITNILARDIYGSAMQLVEKGGHMAPLTHAPLVNSLIEKHILEHSNEEAV